MRGIPSKGGEDSTFPPETFLLIVDDLMMQDNMRLEVIASVGTMFAVRTGEPAGTTVVVSTDMGSKVGPSRKGAGAEGTEERAWILAMSENVDLEHGSEDRSEQTMETGMVAFQL